MSARAKLSFSHMGVFVTDINKMVDFYTRVLGLVVSDRDVRKDGTEIAFMTLDPREHHQVVFATGRPADFNYNVIQQLSFRAPSLSALRETYVALKREPILELGPIYMATRCQLISATLRAIAWKSSSIRSGTCRSRAPSRWTF